MTLFLYNGYPIKAPVDNLIVVEGFTGVWWLVQNKLPNVVATMGTDCSERQAELIVSLVKPNGLGGLCLTGVSPANALTPGYVAHNRFSCRFRPTAPCGG